MTFRRECRQRDADLTGVRQWVRTPPPLYVCNGWTGSILNGSRDRLWLRFSILAIAALKLGAAKAIGIAIDPQAIQASRDNAERNGVSDRLELHLPKDQPEAMKADVVVANIPAGPLRELAPLISVLPVEAVCWGFQVFRQPAESVCDAYAELSPRPGRRKEEWCRITAVANLSRGRPPRFSTQPLNTFRHRDIIKFIK